TLPLSLFSTAAPAKPAPAPGGVASAASAAPNGGARPSPLPPHPPGPRRGGRPELGAPAVGRLRHPRHPTRESSLVRVRRLLHAADLPHVLQCGRVDLLACRRRLEVVERSDVPAHGLEATGGSASERRQHARSRAAPGGRATSASRAERRTASSGRGPRAARRRPPASR